MSTLGTSWPRATGAEPGKIVIRNINVRRAESYVILSKRNNIVTTLCCPEFTINIIKVHRMQLWVEGGRRWEVGGWRWDILAVSSSMVMISLIPGKYVTLGETSLLT